MTQLPIVEIKSVPVENGSIIIFHQDETGLNQYCTVNVTNTFYTEDGVLDSIQVTVLKPGISNFRINAKPVITIGKENFVYGQIVPPREQLPSKLPKDNSLIFVTKQEVDHTLDVLYKGICNFDSAMATTDWCLDYVKELNLMPYRGKRARNMLNTWVRNDDRFEAKGGYVRAVPLEVAKKRRQAKLGLGVAEAPAKEAFPLLAEDERYVDVTKVMQGFVTLMESGLLGKLIPVNIPKDVST